MLSNWGEKWEMGACDGASDGGVMQILEADCLPRNAAKSGDQAATSRVTWKWGKCLTVEVPILIPTKDVVIPVSRWMVRTARTAMSSED